MRRLAGRVGRDQRGAALVESLVASALLAVALVVLVGSLSSLAIGARRAEQVSVTQAAARSQAAHIKAAPYQASGSYATYLDALPSGVTRVVTVTWWDGTSAWVGAQNGNGLEKVALEYRAGGRVIVALEFLKADR